MQCSIKSVNSQRLEYKSLEKYPLLEFPQSEAEDQELPAAQTRKLRSVRSQDKVPPVETPGRKMKSRELIENSEEKVGGVSNTPEADNEALRRKIKKIIKQIKNEEKVGESLTKQIQELSEEEDEDEGELAEQAHNLRELGHIRQ